MSICSSKQNSDKIHTGLIFRTVKLISVAQLNIIINDINEIKVKWKMKCIYIHVGKCVFLYWGWGVFSVSHSHSGSTENLVDHPFSTLKLLVLGQQTFSCII